MPPATPVRSPHQASENPASPENVVQRDRAEQRLYWRAWRTELAQRFPEAHRAASQAMSLHLNMVLASLQEVHRELRIGLYWPIRGEPDWRDMAPLWRNQGMTLLLPVVQPEHQLKFRRWSADSTLTFDRWGIGFPARGPWWSPDVLIAPCLGYDARGWRLGYGGGYYDRLLAASALPLFGMAFYSQRVVLSPQPYDRPLAGLITEQGLQLF